MLAPSAEVLEPKGDVREVTSEDSSELTLGLEVARASRRTAAILAIALDLAPAFGELDRVAKSDVGLADVMVIRPDCAATPGIVLVSITADDGAIDDGNGDLATPERKTNDARAAGDPMQLRTRDNLEAKRTRDTWEAKRTSDNWGGQEEATSPDRF